MSIEWPDGIDSGVKSTLSDALHDVFETTIPDPHERGDQLVANGADVASRSDGSYLVTVSISTPLQKYVDATSAGDGYLDADDHADNPGMVVFDTIRDYGIPIPEDDPYSGVLFDRKTDSVAVRFPVDPADIGGDA